MLFRHPGVVWLVGLHGWFGVWEEVSWCEIVFLILFYFVLAIEFSGYPPLLKLRTVSVSFRKGDLNLLNCIGCFAEVLA